MRNSPKTCIFPRRLLLLLRRVEVAFCFVLHDLGEQGSKNQQKSSTTDQIHKTHTPNIQGRVSFEEAEAPQAAATQPQRAWGALKSLKITKSARYMLPKLRGVLACFFLREPKRRRQLRHRRKGLGILKPKNIVAFCTDI